MMDNTVAKPCHKLKFMVEYSPSRVALCVTCNGAIGNLELRLAIKRSRSGKMWHHFDCFFTKFIPSSTDSIDNIDNIRYEDYERIEDKLKNIEYSDIFKVYYTMDASQICIICSGSIVKGALHVFTLVEEFKKSDDDGVKCSYHLDCFVNSHEELNFYGTAESLAGYSMLDEIDKQLLKEKLNDVVKPKCDTANSDLEVEINAKMKQQSEVYFGFFDKLQSIDGGDRDSLLKYNSQLEPKSKIEKVELLTDCMTFGSLRKCPKCVTGQLLYKNGSYLCYGMLSKNRDCCFECRTPERIPFIIPDNLKQKYSFLSDYVYTKRTRVTRAALRSNYFQEKRKNDSMDMDDSLTSVSCRSIASQTTCETPTDDETFPLPLAGRHVCCVGLSSSMENEFEKVVENLGGKIVKDVFDSAMFLVVDDFEVNKDSTLIIDAKKLEVPIVSPRIIDVLKSIASNDFNNFLFNLVKCHSYSSIASLPNSLKHMIDESNGVVAKKAKNDKEFTAFGYTNKEKQILKIDVVDSRFEFADSCHIYKSDELYSVVLNKFDTSLQKSTYYSMQLLETDPCNYYWVFRSWGRIGTNFGDTAAKDFVLKELAINYFEYIYYTQTGNPWKQRKHLKKVAGKFCDLHVNNDCDTC